MEYFLYSTLALLSSTLIGWSLSYLLLPGRLKEISLASAPLFGYAYIVFSSYIFYRLNFDGANSYANIVAIPPIIVLAYLFIFKKINIKDQKLTPVFLYIFSFFILSSFYLIAGGQAQSLSLRNMDILDLALQARFLQEFPRDTTIGFMGQSGYLRETTDAMWAGPSLFSGYLSAFLGLAPYKLQSISMAIISAQATAFVWLIARRCLALGRNVSLAASVLYAVNPLAAYVLWMSFAGQTISVSLILAGVYFFMSAMEKTDDRRQIFFFAPALITVFSAILITYTYMFAVLGLMLGVYLFVLAVARKSTRDFWSGLFLLIVAAIAAMILNPFRIAALPDMIPMLASGNGWFHAWLSPERQMGLGFTPTFVSGQQFPTLMRVGGALLVTLVSGILALNLWRQRNPERIAFVIGLALTAVLIAFVLAVGGAENGVLGSYRSFKIAGTFVAFTILALAIPFDAKAIMEPRNRLLPVILFFAVLMIDFVNIGQMVLFGYRHAYVMPVDFHKIQKLETLRISDSSSPVKLNFADAPNFDLYWAHYFTLKNPSVFERFPYGGRIVEPGKRPYKYTVVPVDYSASELGADIFTTDEKNTVGSNAQVLNSRFQLVLANEEWVSIKAGDGWWPTEGTHRWTGSKGRAFVVQLHNNGVQIKQGILVGRFVGKQSGFNIKARIGNIPLIVTVTSKGIETAPFNLPLGQTDVEFMSSHDPVLLSTDPRTLGHMFNKMLFTDTQAGSIYNTMMKHSAK